MLRSTHPRRPGLVLVAIVIAVLAICGCETRWIDSAPLVDCPAGMFFRTEVGRCDCLQQGMVVDASGAACVVCERGCGGRSCGWDRCRETYCGDCPAPLACLDGRCRSCEQADGSCGSDGCGGLLGACPAGTVCWMGLGDSGANEPPPGEECASSAYGAAFCFERNSCYDETRICEVELPTWHGVGDQTRLCRIPPIPVGAPCRCRYQGEVYAGRAAAPDAGATWCARTVQLEHATVVAIQCPDPLGMMYAAKTGQCTCIDPAAVLDPVSRDCVPCLGGCEGRECGPNPCGSGSCGGCGGGEVCLDGRCRSCQPDRGDCGDDGCGGYNGDCPSGQACNHFFKLCVAAGDVCEVPLAEDVCGACPLSEGLPMGDPCACKDGGGEVYEGAVTRAEWLAP